MSKGLFVALIALCLIGVAAAGGGGAALAQELRRGATKAELDEAARQEKAVRWRTWTAERIFPATFKDRWDRVYTNRVGIAPGTSCAAALDAEAVKALEPYGCARVLRATYADRSGTLLSTVAVVALRDNLEPGIDWKAFGAKPVGLPGTVSARFAEGQVQRRSYALGHPYLVLSSEGYADGRQALSTHDFRGLEGLTADVSRPLLADLPPCQVKEVVQC